MADHAVSDQRVCAIKEMVIEIKVTLFFSWRCWKPLIFTLEFWKARSQQIELHGAVHIDTHQLTRPIPERFGQALGIRNRLIEVHRCHMEAMPFPGRKYFLKFCAVQAKRHDRRDEFRKLHHVDGLPHYRELTQNDGKKSPKVCTTETNRNYRCDKAGKFCHIDVSAEHFVGKFAQSHRRRIEVAPDLHRIDRGIRSTGGIETKVIYGGIYNPGDFRLPGLSLALADQFFVTGGG